MERVSNWNLDMIYEELRKDEVSAYTKYNFSHPQKTNNKEVNLPLGRIWFNLLLPDDFELINEPIDQKKSNEILNRIAENYDSEKASEILTLIQKEAFNFSSFQPNTFRADAFTPSDEWKEKKKEFQQEAPNMSSEEFEEKKKELTDELMKELDEKGVTIQDGMESGMGKVDKDVWSGLMVSKGETPDIEGNIARIPEGTADGYNVENYYKASGQARRGFYYKSTAVQDPGYLARKITMSCANLKITQKDCRTKKTLKLFADKDRAKTLVGRYHYVDNELKVINSASEIEGQTVYLRSPLHCKTKKGYCSVCYGKLAEKVGSERVGILAGGAVNNEAVNAMMKLRHKSDQVNVINVDFEDLTKKASVNHSEFEKYLDIGKNEIKAKEPVTVIIDTNHYKNDELIDTGEKVQIPGIFDISVGEGENTENLTLPYNFTVDLYRPNDTDEKGRYIKLNYEPGETIIYKEKYSKDIDPKVISKLFDGTTKYVQDPGVLLDTLSKELPKTDSVHLEIVISNMFRSKQNPETPGRLVNYKNVKLYGVKDLPFLDSWLGALAFENVNKAVKSGLVSGKEAEGNPIEKRIIDEEYKN